MKFVVKSVLYNVESKYDDVSKPNMMKLDSKD